MENIVREQHKRKSRFRVGQNLLNIYMLLIVCKLHLIKNIEDQA